MVTLSGGCNITPPSAISIQHRAHKEHSGGISFTLNSYSIFIAPKSLRLSLLERRTISQRWLRWGGHNCTRAEPISVSWNGRYSSPRTTMAQSCSWDGRHPAGIGGKLDRSHGRVLSRQ